MKTENVLLFLSGAAATYVVLAFAAGPTARSKTPSLLSDPVPEAHAETTGTRLSAKITTGSDGSQLFEPEVLHDTTLDADCTFHKAADGSIRCLPIVNSSDNSFNMAYTDDKCTNQVVFVDPAKAGCDQLIPKYVHTYVSIPYCGATEQELGIHIFQVGALAGSPSPTYIKNPQGNCVQGGGVFGGLAYELSAELPPSSFVEGTLGLDP